MESVNNDIKYNQSYNNETHLEEIQCNYPKEKFDKNFKKAMELVKKTASLPGFRKGHIPEKVLATKFFQEISDKAVNLCIEDAAKNIPELTPRPLEPLNVPKIEADEQNNLNILFTYLPVPTVEITDISKIKVEKVKAKEVSDEDTMNEVKNVWFQYAKQIDENVKKEDFKEELLNDEFFEKSGIQKANPDVKSVESFKKIIADYIQGTYDYDSKLTWEQNIIAELTTKSKFDKIDGLIKKELDKRIEDYKNRFTQIGMNADEYLTKNNTSVESLSEEWRPQVEKDIKMEILLQNYSADNKIEVTEEEVNAEYENLDPQTKKQYNNPDYLKNIIRYNLTNRKAYIKIIEQVEKNIETAKKD